MKCTIPEISWHNREPVLSIDIHPLENSFYRLASGGSDTLILIWQLKIGENGAVNVEILAELTRHQRAVNCVKWSPNGTYLASGDDDANIIIWQLKTDSIPSLDGDTNDKETWNVYKILRGHKDDIYDICWSPDSTKLLTGSVDNSAIVWDITKGKNEHIITDHKSFVQGVAWDPKGQFIATLSSDRVCRVFDQNGRHIRARIGRGLLPVGDSHKFSGKDVKYFHDDTFKTFFRRLTFSPDGSFLVVPSGSVETEESKNALYTTYIFTLDSLKQPVAILPAKQCSIVAKCSPVLYELRPDGSNPVIDLPYRMIIALATDSDVILYDTQQQAPFAHLQNIHYTRLTDLAWSHDGLLLAASSTDGFITLVTFDPNELGTEYIKDESILDDCVLNISGCEELEKEEMIEPPIIEVKPKKPSFLEQWASKAKGPKRKTEELVEQKLSPKKIKEVCIDLTDSPQKVENEMKQPEIKRLIPKRITPITLGSPKRIKPTKVGEIESRQIVNPNFNPQVIETPLDDKLELDVNKLAQIIVDEENVVKNNENVKSQCDLLEENVRKKIKLDTNIEKVPNKPEIIKIEKEKRKIIPIRVETPQKTEEVLKNKVTTSSSLNSADKKSPGGTKLIGIKIKPKVTTPSNLNSADKKSPGGTKLIGIKRTNTPKMSLLNFFKPKVNQEKVNLINDEPKLITEDVKEPSIISTPIHKKAKQKIIEEKLPITQVEETARDSWNKSEELIEICDDSEDIPEDFHLHLEDTTNIDNADKMANTIETQTTEKENKDLIRDKNVELIKSENSTHRRIPLITLSSPKNKKKKP